MLQLFYFIRSKLRPSTSLLFFSLIVIMIIIQLLDEQRHFRLHFKSIPRQIAGLPHLFITRTPPKPLRLFCMVLTRPNNHRSKADHVQATWGRRCDRLMFVSSSDDSKLNVLNACPGKEDDRHHLWCKTKNGFLNTYRYYLNDYDWFLKADDDTYIIVDNLKRFLSGHKASDPIFFGCNFKIDGTEYMSGGAGYVLSREALRRFGQLADVRDLVTSSNTSSVVSASCAIDSDVGVEDFEMGKCLASVGVVAGDSRDHLSRGRFFPFQPFVFIMPKTRLDLVAPWFDNYTVHRQTTGQDCCSDSTIAFHYVSPEMMHVMDFLLYRIRIR